MKQHLPNKTYLLAFILVTTPFAHAQTTPEPPEKDLYTTIANLDSSLFATAYTCNTAKNTEFFTEDLEFYHDKMGLIESRKTFLDRSEKKFCGPQNGFKLRRALVTGSMKVYPLNDYGAIQTGEHQFYQTSNGEKEKLVEVGKFTHIWQKKDGAWRISRVISYDHREIK